MGHLFERGPARTGIDIGASAIKLLRMSGTRPRRTITHAGIQVWEPEGTAADIAAASDALRRLLRRLGLNKRNIGHIAVAVAAEDAVVREAVLPQLSQDELARALPYEAPRYLSIEQMESPIIGHQVLGPAPPASEGGPAQMRVLLAAVARDKRDFPVQVLSRLGLEPAVVDLESLAGLNALFSFIPAEDDGSLAHGILDIGRSHAAVHVSARAGGLLTRSLAATLPAARDAGAMAAYAATLSKQVADTLTFYRGRFRREVGDIRVCGGGALLPQLRSLLAQGLSRTLLPVDPLEEQTSVRGLQEVADRGPCLAIAWGLCQWWDQV